MKKKIIVFLLFFTVSIISFIYTIKWLSSFDLNIDEETLKLLLESSGSINKENRVLNKIVAVIKDTSLINPVSLILDNYEYKVEPVSTINMQKEEQKEEQKEDQKPIVYIYNTHQKEKYGSTKEININYSVMDASFYLQEQLKKYGIESVVETLSISDVLDSNNWNYATSYKVSRMFIEKAKENNPTLKYYIDIHRDSVNKKISTVDINGKKYARTMFLLGLENPSYKLNEKEINILENYLDKNYPGLSRGIYKKQGKGVNGVYNQDFSSFCVLIEVGGEENNYEEVQNTMEVIAEMYNFYIGDKIEQ